MFWSKLNKDFFIVIVSKFSVICYNNNLLLLGIVLLIRMVFVWGVIIFIRLIIVFKIIIFIVFYL